MTDREDNGDVGSVERRVWRLEQRLQDVVHRLDKIEQNLHDVRERQDERRWRLDLVETKVAGLEKHTETLEKRAATGMFGDYSPLVKFVLYIAAAMVVALATGQALNVTGLVQ